MRIPTHRSIKYDVDMSTNLVKSMQDNFELFDETFDQIYNYESRYKAKFIDSDKIYDESQIRDVSKDKLISIINSNVDMQNKLGEIILNESKGISKSFNKNADAYNRQLRISNIVNSEVNELENKTKKITDDIHNDKRQIEINNYYYKKNKAQINILVRFIILCAIIYVLVMIQNNINESVYVNYISIIIGLCISFFIINLCYNLYDIMLRDDINFDEYINNWNVKIGLKDAENGSMNTDDDDDKEGDEDDFCDDEEE